MKHAQLGSQKTYFSYSLPGNSESWDTGIRIVTAQRAMQVELCYKASAPTR